jgi:hypothetical protein
VTTPDKVEATDKFLTSEAHDQGELFDITGTASTATAGRVEVHKKLTFGTNPTSVLPCTLHTLSKFVFSTDLLSLTKSLRTIRWEISREDLLLVDNAKLRSSVCFVVFGRKQRHLLAGIIDVFEIAGLLTKNPETWKRLSGHFVHVANLAPTSF